MKLTAILLLVCLFELSANVSYSQLQTVSMRMKDKAISEVLREIETKSDYSFFYQREQVDVDKKVSVDVVDESIESILNEVFKDQDVAYEITDKNTILIVPEKLAKESQASQQKRTISGKVTDSNGEPIPGATVLVKGSTTGVITDFNGKYSITNLPDGVTLQFSFVGMKSQEIVVGNQTLINITMQVDAIGVEEVVAVGYGTQKRESLTSAITTVDSKKLQSRPTIRLAGAIQGLTPGVEIRQPSGQPGASMKINIRGANLSTYSSNDALVIIDGIPSTIDAVAPEDVESISILKDAAAASIYGARASGGVILITTKRGEKGVPKVSYSGVYGTQNRIYKFEDHQLGSVDWLEANNEARVLDGGDPIFEQSYIDKFRSGNDPNFPTRSGWMDWADENNQFLTKHNVNISGGGEQMTYYASAGYSYQNSFLEHNDFTQKTAQVNFNYQVSDKLSTELSLNFTQDNRDQGGLGSYYGPLFLMGINPPNVRATYEDGTLAIPSYSNKNPIYTNNFGGFAESVTDRFRASIKAIYDLTNSIKIRAAYSANNYYNNSIRYNNKLSYYNESGDVYFQLADASLSETWWKESYLSWQTFLEYKKKFNEHNVFAQVGYVEEKNRFDRMDGSTKTFLNDQLFEINASLAENEFKNVRGTGNEWGISSVVSRIKYDYDSKYFAEFSMRYDGSSRFGGGNKYGFFPAVSTAWRISEERFVEDFDELSNLKLRLSWGQVGNQGSSLYPFVQNINLGSRFFGDNEYKTAYYGNSVNNSLTWESKTSRNIGLDFGFFNQKLTGVLDVFSDVTDGIIYQPPIPTTFGASSPVINAMTVGTRGFEFAVNWKDQIGELKYSVGANLSDATSIIKDLAGRGAYNDAFSDPVWIHSGGRRYDMIGAERNRIYIFETDGLFVDQAEIDASATQNPNTKPGDIKYVDYKNDGVINSDDRVPLDKSTNPHYFYGFNFKLEYKNFDLGAIFQGVAQKWQLGTFGVAGGGRHYQSVARVDVGMYEWQYEKRWTPENGSKSSEYPRLTKNNYFGATGNEQASTFWLKNTGYLRLKNITFGYTIPESTSKKIGLSRARIYVSGENLLTLKGYDWAIDPEVTWDSEGAGSTYYGPTKNFNIGLSVTF